MVARCIKRVRAGDRVSNRAKIREEAKKLNPIDDAMFRKMVESKAFCQEILRVFLDDAGLEVTETVPQWTGANLQGRSVVLDAKCVLGDGRQTDIEVQRSDHDDHQRRVRYNGAVLTTNVTDPGTHYEAVPDVCVVFVSPFDVFDRSHAVYHVDRVIRETGVRVENGFSEVYVNATVNDGSQAAELMKVFTEDHVYNSRFPETSSMKHHYKETERGIEIMCDIVQKIADEEREEGMTDTVSVMNKLIESGRTEDMQRALKDRDYLHKLVREFCGNKADS